MSVLPRGRQWIQHTGRRARLRNLRRVCDGALASRRHEAMVAKARALVATAGHQHPEFAFLVLLARAVELERDTGTDWPALLEQLTDRHEKAGQPDQLPAVAPEGPQGGPGEPVGAIGRPVGVIGLASGDEAV